MGQLLVLKKTSVGYNTFGNDVYMYLEPCIEDWGYHCEGPETFGFSRGDLVNGPIPYIPQKDLPRPNQTSK